MKVHLVDGTYELFRAYFGAPSATAPDGSEVGATRAFVRSMLMLLRSEEVSHVAVAFDSVIESFRNEMFAGYKTGDGIAEDLASQFRLVEDAAQALGLVVWRMVEFEADDALAAGAARYAADPRVDQVLLCSPDKDLAQCVRGSQVVCWDRLRDRVLDEAGVVAKFGVAPASIPDYLGLVGDSADGIPGLPRWGAKTAATVLARYRHIDEIPDDEYHWEIKVRGAATLAEILRANRGDAGLYRDLATLRTDVPLAEDLDDLEWRGALRPELESICARLGQPRLLNNISTWRT
jgi:5'-3' exonuclease